MIALPGYLDRYEQRQKAARAANAEHELLARIHYIYDPRTGLCFAATFTTISHQQIVNLATVPCEAAERVWHPEKSR